MACPLSCFGRMIFGITGDEAPDALNANEDLKARLESIRLQVGHDMGLGDVSNKAVPKMCLVSKPKNGGSFNTRTFIPKSCHKAIGVLGAVSAATAAGIAGSAICDMATVPDGNQKDMTIEHPSGVFDVRLDYQDGEIIGAGLLRTRDYWRAVRPISPPIYGLMSRHKRIDDD